MAVTFKIDQAGLPAGVAGEARIDGLAADVGGGLAALVTVTASGAPAGSTLTAALLDVPQLPTPDANGVSSFAETAPSSGVWTFTPSALRYGKFRIRVIATLIGGTTQEETLTLCFLSPAGAMEVPALNERGDRTASLVNQGAEVLAATESNKGAGGTGFRAWHRWMLRISKLVEDLVAGGGGGGGFEQTFTNADLVAGKLTVTHNLSQRVISVVVADNTYKQIVPDEVTFQSTSALEIDLSSFGAIAGTWTAVVGI